MNFRKYFKACLAATILMATLLPLRAQVVVERSNEKAVISGTAYFIHHVKKGETAYSVSKAYGITVEELEKENPQAVNGINEGQTLRISVSEVTRSDKSKAKTIKTVHDESRYSYHKLQHGETIYSLSKVYGVSVNDIVTSNQGMDISHLPAGSEIAIPKKNAVAETKEPEVRDTNYVFHKVVQGESLSSIANQYGVSLKDLKKENRDIRFPQVGDYVRIPVTKPEQPMPVMTPLKDSVHVKTEMTADEIKRTTGPTAVKNLKGTFNVAVLLPFYLEENSVRKDNDTTMVKGKPVIRTINRPDEWILPESLGFLEMYQGILLASDTLRSLGLNVNIHTYDIKKDTVDLIRLIKNGDLDKMDLIIGPVYSSNLSIMASYAGGLKIPVVSPVPLMNNKALEDRPYLFMANPSLEVVQDIIAKKASEYYDKNFVFIHADTAGVDPDVKNFKEKVMDELSRRIPSDEIKFREFLFYSRTEFDNDSINRLGHVLSDQTDNIVIIASEEAPVISETMQDLQGLSKKYVLKVFGYPAMRGLDNLDPRYFFDLDILIYSPFWIDYNTNDVKMFNTQFRNKFLTEPSEMSYAWLGYDIAYYFLSGLSIHGKAFISHPEMHNPDLLQTEFDFRRKREKDGFENQKLFPVRFTRENNEVKLSNQDHSDH
ncbi:MAG: LysM peptidoglycan-binding domain-containing protein [Bacteroidales bacterium]|jgi:LysM repeat protein